MSRVHQIWFSTYLIVWICLIYRQGLRLRVVAYLDVIGNANRMNQLQPIVTWEQRLAFMLGLGCATYIH